MKLTRRSLIRQAALAGGTMLCSGPLFGTPAAAAGLAEEGKESPETAVPKSLEVLRKAFG